MEIRRGFLYVASLNPRRGTEAGKSRPVVVIQSELLYSVRHPSTWSIPCTTKLQGESLLRVPLPKNAAGNKEECEIMVDQSRAIDNQRLKKMLGKVPSIIMKDLSHKLRLLGDL